MLSTKYAEDFQGLQMTDTSNGLRILADWQPPPRSFYKLNVDASYQSASRIATFGAVIRDDEEHVCLAAVTRTKGVDSAFQAEIMAILFGLQMTREQDFKDLMVESDCLLAVKEISQKNESLCEWGSLIKDI